jgi:hypothetical protein
MAAGLASVSISLARPTALSLEEDEHALALHVLVEELSRRLAALDALVDGQDDVDVAHELR